MINNFPKIRSSRYGKNRNVGIGNIRELIYVGKFENINFSLIIANKLKEKVIKIVLCIA